MIHGVLRTHNFKGFHFSVFERYTILVQHLRSAILTLQTQKTLLLISNIDISYIVVFHQAKVMYIS